MYRVYKYVVLVGFITIFSCNNSVKVAPEPDKLLTKEQMVNIIADIQIADAGTNKLMLKPDSAHQMVLKYYGLIEEKYHLDFNTINQNFEYYLNKPLEMDSIYVKVIEKLNTIEVEQKIVPKMPDTLNNSPVVTVN